MNKKNQITQANDSSNRIVELSDEDLQQVVGGDSDLALGKSTILVAIAVALRAAGRAWYRKGN